MASTSLTKDQKKTVEDPIKDNGIWIFTDTECKVDRKLCYTWTSLFQEFQDKEFVVLLQEDASCQVNDALRSNKYSYIIMFGCNRMDY